MRSRFDVMTTARVQLTVLAVTLVTVLALPYAAPSICALLGRMNGEMQMSAPVSDAVVQAPDSGDTCCNLDDCGIPQIAFVFGLGGLADPDVVVATPVAPPAAHPTHAPLPVIPPPQA
jgi:hypothetical protein